LSAFQQTIFAPCAWLPSQPFKIVFHESEFESRTIALHTADVENVMNSNIPTGRNHSYGVKKDCTLNKIQGYRAIHNYALDPMHILLEGVIPVELSCILHLLINVQKLFSLAYLNSCVIEFFCKNFVDKKNKPPEVNSIDIASTCISPSMKAMQMWTLVRYLPLIVGHKVPHDNKHWMFLLHLLELVDILFAPVFTEAMINYLELLITDHLHTFSESFGASVRLKPKHHLLVHFPSIIRQSGPPIGMSCLRYELKNSFFLNDQLMSCAILQTSVKPWHTAISAMLCMQH
jgi:hypothetical protein